ncbi:lipopolysaccharide assembly protein LapA domain-containing protein [Colwelliaceae bacterium 6471]
MDFILRVYFTLFLIIVLLAIAFIFGSQNEQTITLNYLIARAEMSVAAAVSLFTMIGFFLGLLFSLFWKLLRTVRSKKTTTVKKAL